MVAHKTYDLATRVGAHGPDRIEIGADHKDQPVIIDRTWRPSCLVSGEPGSGKGGALRVLQYHDATVGNQMVVITPGSGEFGWLEGVASIAPSDPDDPNASREVTVALEWVLREMERRQSVLTKTVNPATGTLGVAKFTDLTPPPWRRLILYIDELPYVCGDEAKIDTEPGEVKKRAVMLAAIVKRGRKVGVNVVLSSQYPTIGGTFGQINSDTGGGIFKSTTQRIHCDRDSESLKAVFDHIGPPKTNKVLDKIEENRPGRAAVGYAQESDGGGVIACQIIWIGDDKVMDAVEAYDGPPPVDFRALIRRGDSHDG